MLWFWFRSFLCFHHLLNTNLLFFLLFYLLLFFLYLLHFRFVLFSFLFLFILFFQFFLCLLISSIIVSEMSTILLLMFNSLQPIIHIVLCYLNRMSNILVICLFEKEIMLMIVASYPNSNVGRNYDISPISTNKTGSSILFFSSWSITC